MRTRIAFLVVAAALTAGGLFTGIAQSQQPQAPDQSRQRAATKMVQDAYKAGKGRVHAVAKQDAAIEARLKALNYEAHRATGMPPVPEKLRKAQGLPEG